MVNSMRKRIYEFFDRVRDDKVGATAVEYAMIVGVIAVGAYAALTTLSGKIDTLLNSIKLS